jgi:NAD+ kinase
MDTKIRKVGIITKKESELPQQIGQELEKWFADRSIVTITNQVTPDLDLLLILGGDGTLLHVAAEASAYDIPVVGVNLGSLGFLTEVAVQERHEALQTILDGQEPIEERMMLKVRVHRNDAGPTEYHYALNDIVISKDNIDQIVKLSTWADKEYITTYKADGLIFSTPTGSTAYNLSAGGPIVHPMMQNIMVTPICPFMLESRPILLPADTRLVTRLAASVHDVKVIVDGRHTWSMHGSEILEVRKAEKPLRLIGSPKKGYFEILRNKLNWGGRNNRQHDTLPDIE